MGICQSKDEQSKTNAQIERELKLQNQTKIVKIVLLGTGNSGKTTMFNMLKNIHEGKMVIDDDDAVLKEERAKEEAKKDIITNVVTSMCKILFQNGDDAVPIIHPSFPQLDQGDKLNDIIDSLRGRWADIQISLRNCVPYTDIRAMVADSIVYASVINKHPLYSAYVKSSIATGKYDDILYFLENTARVLDPNYLMTQDDLLRVRRKTTTVNIMKIREKNTVFEITDVGGQRKERQKWVRQLVGCNAVMFVVSISEYDQAIEEDAKANSLVEAKRVFESITRTYNGLKIPYIVFFNKSDLFEKKLARGSFKTYFPEFRGSETPSVDTAYDYVLQWFLSKVNVGGNDVYAHLTCAVNKNNIRLVFESVKDSLLKTNIFASY